MDGQAGHPSFVYSAVLPFDGAKLVLARHTVNAVDMVDGESAGTLRFADNFNLGYGVFLRRHDAQPGHVLRLLAHPDGDTCDLDLGGDELLGEPCDG